VFANIKELLHLRKSLKLRNFHIRHAALDFKFDLVDEKVFRIQNRLKNLFAENGSDKSTRHSYHLTYGIILDNLSDSSSPRILEIGLGTNNVDIPSSMTTNYRPKAGIKSFQSLLPMGEFFGADIDPKLLSTPNDYFLDMSSEVSLVYFKNNFSDRSLDLIIEDGLHQPRANILTLFHLLPLIKPGGYYVIEDIDIRFKISYRLILKLIPKDYECIFLDLRFQVNDKLRDNCIFIARRRS
jgi:hypothetical protein